MKLQRHLSSQCQVFHVFCRYLSLARRDDLALITQTSTDSTGQDSRRRADHNRPRGRRLACSRNSEFPFLRLPLREEYARFHLIARSTKVMAPALMIKLKYPSQNLRMDRKESCRSE